MTPAAAPLKLPAFSAVKLTETLLHMALSAAIPISAVVFVVLSL
jgi:hypothetical protein